MKKNSLLGLILGLGLIAFGAAVSITSCEVGLGSAVDVLSPELTIQSPATGNIIRDVFAVSGVYEDDGKIDHIKITLRPTSDDGKAETHEYRAEVFEETNTWRCVIDPFSETKPVLDGSYEATIEIADTAKHVTTKSRQFTIDNTPPVVVLQKPSSDDLAEDNLIQSYGQYLTFEGQAADDNDVERLVVKFYSKDDPTTVLWEKEIRNIPPTISLDVAKFLDESDDTYSKIYGDEKDGEKFYYFTITAYDGSQRYPVDAEQTAQDKWGNPEESYILWTDWEELLSEYQKSTGSSLKIPDLYHIKSGTYTASGTGRAAASAEKSAGDLWNKVKEKSIKCGSFKLNPENSPTYSISGLSLGEVSNVENDGSLTVQLSKGLDGISLSLKTLKVYLLECDVRGNAVEGAGRIYPKTSKYENKGDGQFQTKISKDDAADKDGKSVKLVYGKYYIVGVEGEDTSGNKLVPSIDPTLVGKQYIIHFKAKNVAPELEISNPVGTISYLKKATTLEIAGSTVVPDGYPTITITCKKDAEAVKTIWTYTVTDEDRDEENCSDMQIAYKFTHLIDKETAEQFGFDQENSGQYVFEITSDLDNMPTSRSKTVIYDVDGPTINIDSMLPTAEKYKGTEDGAKETGDYLNSLVDMKVAIVDAYDNVYTEVPKSGETDRRPYFIIVDAQTGTPIEFRAVSGSGDITKVKKEIKHYITTPAKQTFTINTNDIANGDESLKVKVKIFAEDRGGNLGVDAADTSKSYFEREYTVDQTTDLPVILPYSSDSLSLIYETKESLEAYLKNVTTDASAKKCILTTESALQLTLADDDGIAKSVFKIGSKNEDTDFSQVAGKEQLYNDKPTKSTFSYTLPSISGKFKCYIAVTDKEENTTEKTFWIVVTGPAPIITIEKTVPDNKIITLSQGAKTESAPTQLSVTVNIDSGYERFLVTRKEEGCAPVTVYELEDSAWETMGLAFTDTFTPSNARTANKVTYTVTDENGGTATKQVSYSVDSTLPVIDPDSISVPNKENNASEQASYRFTATASDDTPQGVQIPETSSKVSKIQYTFDAAKTESRIKTIAGVSSLNETVLFADNDYSYAFASEGTKKIYIRAIDDVGNIGDWVEKEFMYDKAPPAVLISSYKRDSDTSDILFSENSASKSFETGTQFVLKGTASDSNGIKTFEIWQRKDGGTYDDELGILLSDNALTSNGTWTITGLPRSESNIEQTDVDSGTYIYTVRAVDKSEFGTDSAKTTTTSLTVKIDKTKPALTITLEQGDTSDSTAYGENSLKGTAYTFRGTAKDDPVNQGDFSSGFDTLYYAFTNTETEPESYSLSIMPSTDSWSIPMNLATGSGTDTDDTLYEGKKYLWVKGVDKAGNESDVRHVAFMVDQNAPDVEYKVYKNNDTTNEIQAAEDGIVYITDSDATGYTLKGTVTDVNGIKAVLLDGAFATLTGSVWSKTVDVEGQINHAIIAYDGSGKGSDYGKATVKTQTVIFDTTAPVMAVTGFDAESDLKTKWISGTGDTYINGTAGDIGAGLKEIKIRIDGDQNSEDGYTTLALSSNWSYKFTIPDDFTENKNEDADYHTVYIIAEDKAGNKFSGKYYFRYDVNPPVIKNLIVKNATTGAYTKSITDVTASGLAFDGVQTKYRPVELTISAADSTGAAADIGGTNKVITVTTESAQNTTFGQFSQAVATKTLADGEYTFTVKATDYAKNTVQEQVAITVDNTLPVVDTTSLGNWNSTNSGATINATFTETNPEAAYYYIDDRSNPSLTQTAVPDADWVSMNINGNTATKACSFSDGKGKVYIKVVDKAGNVGYGTALDYEVDTKAPDVCTLQTVQTVNGAALSGSKLINGNSDVVFTLKATDYNDNRNSSGNAIGADPTRVSSVKLTKIGDDTYTGDAIVSGTATLSGGVKTGVWTITIPKAKFSGKTSGSFPVTVTVTDTKGNSKNFQLFTLDIDQVPPTLNSYALSSSYDAGVVSGVQTFYMNNTKVPFTLTGVAKDDREIETVTLTIKSSSETVLKTLTSSDSAWTFTSATSTGAWTTTWAGWTTYVTVELSVKDKAQNVVASPTTFKIIFDTTAPAAMHAVDSKSKDIYFRVADQDNDDITPSDSLWNDDLDKDVGGKYKSGTFGNKETIKIRGNFAESGSGISMIYYQLYTTVPTTTQIDAFVANPSGKATGYFAPKPASETTRRVFYTGDITGVTKDGTVGSGSDAKNYKSIASTYLTTLSGFKEGHNYLVLVAVDNVGNAAVDNISNNYYTINVDTQAPETADMADKYTDGKSDLTLAFTVTDNPTGTNAVQAGIKSVKVKMNGVAAEKTASLNSSTNKYEVTIPASELPASGTYSVSVTAKDAAGTGNSDTRVVGSVIVDKTPPSVRVTSTAGFVKASIANASVYVSDANGLKKNTSNKEIVTYNVYLSTDTSYATSKANGTVEVGSNSEAKVTSIATTNTTTFENGKSYIVRFTVEDIVGNKSYVNTEPYTIDRTGPVLNDSGSGVGGTNTTTAVGAANKYFNAETLTIAGNYTDKAGSVTGSGVTTINYTLTPASGSAISGSWSTADGSYSANLAGFKHGTNTLALTAVDAMGNVSAATTYSVKVDTSKPTVTSGHSSTLYSDGSAALTINATISDTGSGIASVVLSREGITTTVNMTKGSGSSYSANALSLISGLTSGTVTITATAIDNAGNETKVAIANVMVDKVGPELVINTPATNAKTSTSITVKGSASDGTGSGINTTKGITLYYTTSSTVKANAPTTATTSTNASDADSKWVKYETQPTLTGQTWTGTFGVPSSVSGTNTNKPMYICVGAVDKSGSGNAGYSDPVTIVVDTKAPVSTALTIDEISGSSLGENTTQWFKNTTVSLDGTFTDTDGSGVASVKYAVKAAGASAYAAEKTIASNGSYTANVDGLAAGTNTIKVWAIDTAGNTSSAATYTVKVDNKAPTISADYTGVIYASSAACNVNLTVEDEGESTIDNVTLTVGEKAPVTCNLVNGKYTYDIKNLLVDGTVSVTATATDKAGNTTSRVIANVMRDTTGPELVINTPGANATTSNSITVKGSASDGTGSGINNDADHGITLYYTKNSTYGTVKPTASTISNWTAYTTSKPTLSGQTWEGTFNVPDAVAASGNNTTLYICAGAVDKSGSGNPGYSAPVTIVVDRKAPSIATSGIFVDTTNVSTLGSSTTKWFNNTTVNLNGTFTDDGSGVASVRYQLKKGSGNYDTVQIVASDGLFSTNIKDLAAGTNTIKVWAVDTAGNSSEAKEYTVKVDAKTPVITAEYTGVVYADASSCLVELTVTDEGSSEIAAVTLTTENGSVNCTLNETTGKYEANVQEILPQGTASITATASDNAGNSTSRVIANVMKDTEAPTINITTPSANAKTGATISLSGSASDGVGSGINTTTGLTLYYTTSSTVGASAPTASTIGTAAASKWVAYGTKMTLTGQTWEGSFDSSSVAGNNTNTTLYLSVGAVDNAGSGNKGYSDPVTVVVDRAKPQKDSFNVGTTSGDDLGTDTTTWFNNETLNIKGTFTDVGGSGVSAILYTLDTGTEQEIPTTDGTFNTNIAGFETGTHTLKVRAKDKVGLYSNSTSYTIKVDMSQPEISEVTANDFKKITLSNGTLAKTFEFYVTDTGSGVETAASSVTVKAGSHDITSGSNGSTVSVAAVSGQTNKWKATVTLGAADLATLSGNNSVIVTVSDQAGNKSNSQSIGTLNMDTDKPVPSFTSHQASATVNKTITLGGKVTDASNSTIKSIALTATSGTGTSAVTKQFAYPAASGKGTITYANGQWSADLDTTQLYNGTSSQALSLSITATDEADNTSTAVTQSLTIDQNSDRPVVKFTNIVREGTGTSAKYILKYGNSAALEGTLTDDDATSTAVVKVFKASSSAITSATATTTGTTTFNAATGDFTFTPASAADGEKQVYFYIKDNNGNEFYTTYTTNPNPSLGRPYQQYKTDAKTDNNAVLKYSSDSNAPLINSVNLQAYTAASGDNTQNGDATPLGVNCVVGGTSKNYVDLTVSAKDANGIKGIVLKVEQGTTTTYYRSNNSVKFSDTETGVTYANTGSVAATTNDSTNHVYTTSRINITNYVDGQVSVTVKVYDNSGLYNNQESVFRIDRDAPTLTIDNNVKEDEIVYGINKISIGGSVTATDVDKIYYAVTNDTLASNSSTIGTVSDWVASHAYAVNDVVAIVSNGIKSFYKCKTAHTSGTTFADTNWDAYYPNNTWIEVKDAKVTATVIFGGKQSDVANGEVSAELRDWFISLFGQTDVTNDVNHKMSIHFKTVDSCGNAGYSKRTIEVVPNGDKPTITLSYPVDITVTNTTTTNHPSAAGTIRVYGNAEVATGTVKAVYVQIDTNYNAANGFNESGWETGFETCISGKNTDYTVEQIGNRTDLRGVKATGTLNWNLPINGAKEFNPTGTQTSRTMAIRIYGVGGSDKVSEYVEQIFHVDPNAPRIGGDGTVDGVMQLKLVQLNSSGAITKQMPYKPNTWVTGQWYIAASVYDDAGIKTITLDENDGYEKIEFVKNSKNQNASTRSGADDYRAIKVVANDCAAAIGGVTGKKNFDVYIPLPTTDGSGTVNYTIEAVEVGDSGNSSSETIKVNYDNTAPRLGTVGHENYNANAYNVKQDNGFYHLFGYATDTESGSVVSDLKAVAFYFVRRGSANTRVYDPMYKDKYEKISENNYKRNYVEIPEIPEGGTNTTNITYDYGMFWNTKTVTRDSDLSVLKLSAKDDNIHAGGFVLMEGTIYTIRTVSTDGKTITLKTEAPAGITTAKFAYAMVIDNFDMTESIDTRTKITDSSAYGYGYYAADSTADDGDLMQEKWASGKWEAWINSNNIPDGPIEIHYVAIDNAQNFSVGIVGNLSYTDYKTKTTLDVSANGNKATASNGLISGFDYIYDANKKAYVSNNSPRIAGVTVGTDYNGNGTVEDSEKQTKYVAQKKVQFSGVVTEVAGNITDLFIASGDNTANGAAMMALKGASSVEVEIIGGNGNMYYQYSIDGDTYKDHATIAALTEDTENTDDTGKFVQNTTAMNITRETEGLANDADYQATYYKSTTLPAINFTENAIATAITSNTEKTWFTFEFWDSTEETSKFVNSQYAQLKLPLSIQVHDSVPPNTVINDLYWNSSSDNSVYKDSNGDLFGHIELKKDLTYTVGEGDSATTVTTQLGTDYGTDDDKISGKVVFSGYAYDNKRLARLRWGIKDRLTGTEDDPILEAWPQDFSGYAEYTSGTGWSTSGDANLNNQPFYYFKVYDDAQHGAYLDQKGHKVYWELTVDTSYVQEPGQVAWSNQKAVGKDLYVYVWAEDSSYVDDATTPDNKTNMNPIVKTDGTDAQNISPNYKVDILPYITGVKTWLSKKNKNNPTIYSRTAQGHYPIASTETEVIISGYNLKAGNGDVTINASNFTTGGYSYEVTTGYTTINNLNNNDAHGDYDLTVAGLAEKTKVTNMYNRQPNTSTNLKLTDDIYFDIWEFKKAASPKYGRINEPVMRINPSNGMIGFAFANAADALSLPNGSNNSYIAWQKNYADYKGINFVYDKNGRVHSISTGMDTEPNNGYAGYMQYILSSWGGNGIGNMYNWNGNVTAALESIGLPAGTYVGGTALAARVIDVDRFGTPSMAVAGTNRVYLAYYDSDNDQIRFRYGTVQETKGSRNNNNGQLSDGTGSATTGTIGNDTGAGATNYGQHSAFEADPARYSLIAGKTQGASPEDTGNGTSEFVALDVIASSVEGPAVYNCDTDENTYQKTLDVPGFTRNFGSQLIVNFTNPIHGSNNNRPTLNVSNTGASELYNNGTRMSTNNNPTVAAGTYLLTYTQSGNRNYWNIEPAPNYAEGDIVVIVWFDGNNLMYTYRYGDKDDTDCLSTGVANKWAQPQVIFNGVGHYCTIKVDKNNGIHIAAYNRTGADLYYCYMSSYDDYANKKTALIDSYSQVGKYISLDTALVLREGSTTEYNVVPYITYYGDGYEGLPKMAYLPGGIDKDNPVVPNGADNDTDLFTAEWEVSLIPTSSEVNEDNMNIALWKDAAGVLTSSAATRPANFTDPEITSAGGTTSETANSATWYGNGISNLVLGYGIVDNATGFIEIAQRK